MTLSSTPILISHGSMGTGSAENVVGTSPAQNQEASRGLAISLDGVGNGAAIVKEGHNGTTLIKVTMTRFANYNFDIEIGERSTSIIVPSSRINESEVITQSQLRHYLSSLIAKAPRLDLGPDEKWATPTWKKTTKQIVVNLCLEACEEWKRFQQETSESDDDISLSDIEDDDRS